MQPQAPTVQHPTVRHLRTRLRSPHVPDEVSSWYFPQVEGPCNLRMHFQPGPWTSESALWDHPKRPTVTSATPEPGSHGQTRGPHRALARGQSSPKYRDHETRSRRPAASPRAVAAEAGHRQPRALTRNVTSAQALRLPLGAGPVRRGGPAAQGPCPVARLCAKLRLSSEGTEPERRGPAHGRVPVTCPTNVEQPDRGRATAHRRGGVTLKSAT